MDNFSGRKATGSKRRESEKSDSDTDTDDGASKVHSASTKNTSNNTQASSKKRELEMLETDTDNEDLVCNKKAKPANDKYPRHFDSRRYDPDARAEIEEEIWVMEEKEQSELKEEKYQEGFDNKPFHPRLQTVDPKAGFSVPTNNDAKGKSTGESDGSAERKQKNSDEVKDEQSAQPTPQPSTSPQPQPEAPSSGIEDTHSLALLFPLPPSPFGTTKPEYTTLVSALKLQLEAELRTLVPMISHSLDLSTTLDTCRYTHGARSKTYADLKRSYDDILSAYQSRRSMIENRYVLELASSRLGREECRRAMREGRFYALFEGAREKLVGLEGPRRMGEEVREWKRVYWGVLCGLERGVWWKIARFVRESDLGLLYRCMRKDVDKAGRDRKREIDAVGSILEEETGMFDSVHCY